MGIRVHCLALGDVNLTSPAGKMTMTALTAVAQFERGLLIERTQADLERATAEGRVLRRPVKASSEQMQALKERTCRSLKLQLSLRSA